MTQTPKKGELEPHVYVGSAMHMGDCAICGNVHNSPIHNLDAKPMTKAQDTDAQSKIDLWIAELRESNVFKYAWHHELADAIEALQRRVIELGSDNALLRSQVKALTQNTEGESE